MQFETRVTVTNGAAAPDPRAAPADVPDELLLRLDPRKSGSDVQPARLLLALEAPAAEGVTVDLWVLDEGTEPVPGIGPAQPNRAARRFYRCATGVALTGGELVGLQTANLPPGGRVYLRRTADTLTAPRVVKASCADA